MLACARSSKMIILYTNYINSLLLIVEILWDTTRFVFKLLTDVLGHPFTSFFVS